VIATFDGAIAGVLKRPEVCRKLDESFGMFAGRSSTPEEFGAHIGAKIKAWTPVLKVSGIKLE